MLIRRTLLTTFFAVLLTTAATTQASEPFDDSKTTFPLMAWDYADDGHTLREMAACGITQVAFIPDDLAVLDLCSSLGLQAIVFDESLSGSRWDRPPDPAEVAKNLPAIIDKVGHHPAVLGYHLKDEPGPPAFPGLGKAIQTVKDLAPGKWPYVNLLPGDGEPYRKYLEDFMRICDPPILSYDRYVIVEPENTFGSVFWSNLAVTREVALKYDVPLYNIVLTSPHWGYRDLTPTDIRMQVYGSLVYGVKGLGYYKFMSQELDILDAPDLGNFRGGPLDEFGNRTPTFDWLRNVNKQVQNLAPYLLRLRSDDVYHVGGALPVENHGVTSSSLLKDIAGGPEFVVGEFTQEDDRSRWVMIVNRSMTAQAQVLPKFIPEVKQVDYVSARTGEIGKFETPYFWLAPGQGVLLKLKGDSIPKAKPTKGS